MALSQCQERLKELQQSYQQYLSTSASTSSSSSSTSSSSKSPDNPPSFLTANNLRKSDQFLLQLLQKIQKIDSRLEITCQYGPTSTSSPSVSLDPILSQALQNARAYMTVEGRPVRIILFAKELRTIHAIDEALRHELTHVHDHLSRKDDLSTCEGLASSEVRAARNGECFRYQSLPSFLMNYCVKKTAIASTCNVFPLQGEECVKKVLDRVMREDNHH